jgi:hypothetical protein
MIAVKIELNVLIEKGRFTSPTPKLKNEKL